MIKRILDKFFKPKKVKLLTRDGQVMEMPVDEYNQRMEAIIEIMQADAMTLDQEEETQQELKQIEEELNKIDQMSPEEQVQYEIEERRKSSMDPALIVFMMDLFKEYFEKINKEDQYRLTVKLNEIAKYNVVGLTFKDIISSLNKTQLVELQKFLVNEIGISIH